jgi:thymidylate synthase ThyX
VDEREALKGVRFPVLDHGHVILLDFMGSDCDIVEAARTSYQAGTKHVSGLGTLATTATVVSIAIWLAIIAMTRFTR